MLSALIISPLIFFASLIAKFDFPDAVGRPQITAVAPIDGAVANGNVRNSGYQPVLFEPSRA